ncbi:hypothetical protein Purlil1_5658 [Purpureocillium lilacinum]|uniref:Uncharacterized protein n=1 Tax=Purpureocillium lilacinum TaxID=33203 RepID=A0ABR0C163_PURLI|nr:hypothetical protein Purlil1_5658 [Purpureocillium lilacinum]
MAPSGNALLCLLALAATAAASLLQAAPTPVAGVVDTVKDIVDHALGALNPATTVAEKAAMVTPTDGANAQWAGEMTITLQNRHERGIKTRHVVGYGAPAPHGNPGTGVIPKNGESVFTVPRGWNGNVVINDENYPVDTGDESQLEGSFMNQGQGERGDINVSYVNGYSVPIVCRCNENNIWTGCSKNLWNYGKCPNDNWKHSCRNDARNNGWNTQPAAFFTPCRGDGGAYTFPADDKANNLNAKCSQERYTCCAGYFCPANPAEGGFH